MKIYLAGPDVFLPDAVEIGRQKFLASVLYADTTFFRMFDFTLLEGSRERLGEGFEERYPAGEVIAAPLK